MGPPETTSGTCRSSMLAPPCSAIFFLPPVKEDPLPTLPARGRENFAGGSEGYSEGAAYAGLRGHGLGQARLAQAAGARKGMLAIGAPSAGRRCSARTLPGAVPGIGAPR